MKENVTQRWLREFEETCESTASPTAVADALAMLGVGDPKKAPVNEYIPELNSETIPAFNAAALCVLNKHTGLRSAVRTVLVRDLRHSGFYGGEFGRIANKAWSKGVIENLLSKKPNPAWVGAEEPEEPEEPEPTGECPLCEGPGMYQGTLGQRPHFRCRNCGIDFG